LIANGAGITSTPSRSSLREQHENEVLTRFDHLAARMAEQNEASSDEEVLADNQTAREEASKS